MSISISYVLVTPYSLLKSRTGGIIARLLSRSDLELAGAQIIAPHADFAKKYAAALREDAEPGAGLLADYVERCLVPQKTLPDGGPSRSLLLLFTGEGVCRKLADICGPLDMGDRMVRADRGTIRATFADYVASPENPSQAVFFEPAVITPYSEAGAAKQLALFAPVMEKADNIISSQPAPPDFERTLVIIKPDNWTFHSARPGAIIDMFSQSGLRIAGVKVHYFSLREALDFYGPVECALKEKLAPVFGKKARETLERDFAVTLDAGIEDALTASFGAAYAREQFYHIVEFMSGHRPGTEATHPAKCMVIVYEGPRAVEKIRAILGATDPAKACDGTIRKEFGSTVMVNAAHASDSVESFQREQKIVRINENTAADIIKDFLRAAPAG
jgi:nucleoside diphosphate kinase